MIELSKTNATKIGAILFAALAIGPFFGPIGSVEAKGSRQVKVLELKIISDAPNRASALTPTSWGVDSSYIGRGEISRLKSVEIFLDNEGRIVLVKVKRLTLVNELVTSFFPGAQEVSIKEAAANYKGPYGLVSMSVKNISELTFP